MEVEVLKIKTKKGNIVEINTGLFTITQHFAIPSGLRLYRRATYTRPLGLVTFLGRGKKSHSKNFLGDLVYWFYEEDQGGAFYMQWESLTSGLYFISFIVDEDFKKLPCFLKN